MAPKGEYCLNRAAGDATRTPLVRRSKAGRAFRDIARRLIGETVPFEDLESGDGLFGRLARLVRPGASS